jgi:outer membrane protein OmpA-like peptidoglycan-associated protein
LGAGQQCRAGGGRSARHARNDRSADAHAQAQPADPAGAAATSPAGSPTQTATSPPTSQPAAGQAQASLSLAIQFDVNSSRVRPESGEVLGNLVAAMLSPDLKGTRFAIEGHTDASGAAAANLRLSQQRADEVRLFLVALGVHPARLKAVGKGSSEPIDPKDPMSADNRRVRVVTLE